jgi:predicted AlkP superfamily pyrophosphatase or phosphodiesterase
MRSSALLLLLFAFHLCSAQKKAVFIILDGIPADVLEQTETPFLDSIATLGGYTRAYLGGEKGGYSQSPTVSAVGYNHVLTGVWAHKHDVYDNDIKNPNYHYWNLFRVVEKANPKLKTAIYSTWLDNRTKLIGDRVVAAGDITVDYSFDGLELDTIRFPHDKERLYIHRIDELVSMEAARHIHNEGPDLSWVYLEYTDDMGHRYGDSPQLTDAVKKADTQVGRIWAAIRERERTKGEEWMIVITTDHGRNPQDGKSHGGQSDRERTVWIVTNIRNTNARFKDTPASVDIMPSILRFMQLDIPETSQNELDGVPFIGPVSVSDVKAVRKGNEVKVTWKTLAKEGSVIVKVATTNHFAEGHEDAYTTVGSTYVTSGTYTFDAAALKSDYLKILLVAPHNRLNYWIADKAK